MVQATTYPGVYVNIAPPQGARPIIGVETSITAVVLDLERGPTDVALRVNPATFADTFGPPDQNYPDGYLVDQFFANGGSGLYVIRARRNGAVAASWADDAWVFRAGRRVPGVQNAVEDTGAWGDRLRIEAIPEVDSARTLILSEEDPANPAQPRRSEKFVGLKSAMISETIAADSKLMFVETAGTTMPITGTLAQNVATASHGSSHTITVTVANTAITAKNQLTVTVEFPAAPTTTPPPPPPSAQRIAVAFQQALRRAAANVEATPTDEVDAKILGYLRVATVRVVDSRLYVSAGVVSGYDPATTLTLSGALGFAGAAADDVGPVRHHFGNDPDGTTPNVGVDGGNPPSELEIIGSPNDRTGIYALDRVDLFNILCLPGLARRDEALAKAAYEEAGRYCEDNRAFLIVDMPAAVNEPPEAEQWMQDGPKLRNAAVYFPRLTYSVTDPATRVRKDLSLANSLTMAGIYARTDTNRGVWKAPAGIEASIALVSELEYNLDDAQNGFLNPIGCNCLRQFPVTGMVSWGARTLFGADARADQHKYIPVIRTTYFLAESLYRGTNWAVFEPNDEPLWSQIRLSVGAFMGQQFRKGAFQGTKARDAFLVKCDAETTTQADIDAGIVNIVVGFAPLKPAEFVVLTIQQLAGEVG